jgi:hypothetical protein
MYILLIASMYFVWEPNPDKIEIPMIVVNTFRALTAATMGVFFISMGIFFGLFWSKFKPHESSKITAI